MIEIAKNFFFIANTVRDWILAIGAGLGIDLSAIAGAANVILWLVVIGMCLKIAAVLFCFLRAGVLFIKAMTSKGD